MKQLLFLLGFILLATAVPAQEAPTLTVNDLVAQIGALRVARTLQLRSEQVVQIKPVLEQVQAAREAQKAAQDAIYAQAGPGLARVDQALQIGQRPQQADLNAAAQAARDNKAAVAATDRAIDTAVQQVYRLLDQNQAKLVETRQQQQARERQSSSRLGDANLANHITGYVVAMRKLLPEEYDSLRVAMGLRLAGLLVSPDNQNFNTAVGDVLRVIDTVRQMSDADFAQRQEQLPQAVGRALRLNVAAAGPSVAITYGEFADFVAGEQTLEALAAYVPAPAMEGQ